MEGCTTVYRMMFLGGMGYGICIGDQDLRVLLARREFDSAEGAEYGGRWDRACVR
jgi:hypothetical protein